VKSATSIICSRRRRIAERKIQRGSFSTSEVGKRQERSAYDR
jgi:hypothetical protein